MASNYTDTTLVIEKDELSLCNRCGGTGIEPTDSSCRCHKCDGLKTINHFSVYFNCDVPYQNENKRIENILSIECGIRDIYRSLGLIDEYKYTAIPRI